MCQNKYLIYKLRLINHIIKKPSFRLYYWNRRYPSDLKFDIDFSNGKWEVVSEEEFEGNSHDKITKKVILKK